MRGYSAFRQGWLTPSKNNAKLVLKLLGRLRSGRPSLIGSKQHRGGAAVLIVCLFMTLFPSPAVKVRALALWAEVNNSISDKEYKKHRYVLKGVGKNISHRNVRFLRTKHFNVLRVQDPKYCFREKCLTYVVVNCRKQICPFASAITYSKLIVPDEGGGIIDGFGSVEFYSDAARATTFLISDDLVTVHLKGE